MGHQYFTHIQVLILCTATCVAKAEERVWTSDVGSQVKGSFSGLRGDMLTIRRTGKENIKLKIDRLSEPDQKYALKQHEAECFKFEYQDLSQYFSWVRHLHDSQTRAQMHVPAEIREKLTGANSMHCLTPEELGQFKLQRERALLAALKHNAALVYFFPLYLAEHRVATELLLNTALEGILLAGKISEEEKAKAEKHFVEEIEPLLKRQEESARKSIYNSYLAETFRWKHWRQQQWSEALVKLCPEISLVEAKVAFQLRQGTTENDDVSCLQFSSIVEKSSPRYAMFWLLKAALLEHPEAMSVMGKRYFYGSGVPQSPLAAAYFLIGAADQGHVDAMAEASECLRLGLGTKKDQKKALRFAKISAESGSIQGMKSLAAVYSSGDDEIADLELSASWYLKAAQRGDSEAMTEIGQRFWDGAGIPRDRMAGIYWLNKSGSFDDSIVKFIGAVVAVSGAAIVLSDLFDDDIDTHFESVDNPWNDRESSIKRFRNRTHLRNFGELLDSVDVATPW